MTTVLVADDDFDNRAIARESLEAAGYTVAIAKDGEEALESIRTIHPFLVLLDLSMPRVNGWEVARRVRETPDLADITLVAFTAHALAGEEARAKAAGCDDYISKPCLPRDLVAKVAEWMVRRKPGQGA